MCDVPQPDPSVLDVLDRGAEQATRTAAEPMEELHVSLRRKALQRVLATLADLERRVIELRFGLDCDDEPASLSETGRSLGISAERVKRIEASALERLALEREIAALAEEAA
jgi:RNA polymerase sigma factor (sigma-70 family)